jgi:hypothetical protein
LVFALLLRQVAHASVGSDVSNDTAGCSSSGDRLALEVAEEVGVRLVESAGAAEGVELAVVAEVVVADGVLGGAGRGKQGALSARLDGGVDILEDVALGDDVGAATDLEGVAGVVVPVVVDLIRELVSRTRLGRLSSKLTAWRRVFPETLGERPEV